ncbi:MAG: repair protein RadC [Bacteroidota bacterium]|jgi:DNA repair protein RadC
MQQHNNIKHWAPEDQPIHKLSTKGAKHLSEVELIAILLQHGTAENNAIELARKLLQSAQNSLQKLSKQTLPDLLALKIKGIGSVKIIRVLAAIELGSRRMHPPVLKKNIRQSGDVAEHLKYALQFESKEIFMVLLLNQANKIIHEEMLSEGGLTGTIADPRILFKLALRHEATGIIICHNHPSGQLQPSRMDDLLTEKVKKAATYFDIKLIDHIIVSTEGYYSYAENKQDW